MYLEKRFTSENKLQAPMVQPVCITGKIMFIWEKNIIEVKCIIKTSRNIKL